MYSFAVGNIKCLVCILNALAIRLQLIKYERLWSRNKNRLGLSPVLDLVTQKCYYPITTRLLPTYIRILSAWVVSDDNLTYGSNAQHYKRTQIATKFCKCKCISPKSVDLTVSQKRCWCLQPNPEQSMTVYIFPRKTRYNSTCLWGRATGDFNASQTVNASSSMEVFHVSSYLQRQIA